MDTADTNRAAAIRKIVDMPAEQVVKVLIFMAGMEAGEALQDRPSAKGGGSLIWGT